MHIPITVEAALPPALQITDGDLFSLLSNLLDNAFEGTDPSNACIHVKLTIVKAYLSVIIENTVSTDIIANNPDLKTTKKKPDGHGIGTQIVRRICNEYNGILQYTCKNGIFTASILLLNE